MIKRALLLLGVLTVAGSAHGAGPGLPPPVFTTSGSVPTLAASGDTVALGLLRTEGQTACTIQLFRLGQRRPPTAVKTQELCLDGGLSLVQELWLGRSAIAAEVYDSPSPHGENYTYFLGPRPVGPLSLQGRDWGWQDSDQPYGYGCRWVVATGGGVIAAAAGPHRLGYERGPGGPQPSCPAGAFTRIHLSGASASSFEVPGIWAPLAADSKHILLSGLDENGDPTGKLSLRDLTGAELPAPTVAAATVKGAGRAWLQPEGLVLESGLEITAPGWSVKEGGDVTVGEGRVFYVSKRALHVRRIRGGPDRTLLTLPAPQGDISLAAGSFGLAIVVAVSSDNGGPVKLYQLPWRTIDRTLTAR